MGAMTLWEAAKIYAFGMGVVFFVVVEILAGLLVIACILVAVLSLIAFAEGMRLGLPFAPSRKEAVQRMIELADIRESDVVFDLGSGDGRLVFAAAEKSQQVYGIEGSWVVFAWARLRQKWFSAKGQFIQANMFKTDLRNADVILCFLTEPLMRRFKQKFERELKDGCRVVSQNAPVQGWTPNQVVRLKKGYRLLPPDVYLYKIRKATLNT